jgi:hypothetical protein
VLEAVVNLTALLVLAHHTLSALNKSILNFVQGLFLVQLLLVLNDRVHDWLVGLLVDFAWHWCSACEEVVVDDVAILLLFLLFFIPGLTFLFLIEPLLLAFILWYISYEAVESHLALELSNALSMIKVRLTVASKSSTSEDSDFVALLLEQVGELLFNHVECLDAVVTFPHEFSVLVHKVLGGMAEPDISCSPL